MNPHSPPHSTAPTGLARALSKLGYCSRSQAADLILAGRVRVNRVLRRDPEWRVFLSSDRITVDEQPIHAHAKTYVMLNKPRGLVTTASDEQGRATVFDCLKQAGLPFLSPVGRLDKASEGLLLLTNNTQWAARITDPASELEKVYHVQIDTIADESLLRRLLEGVRDGGDLLSAKRGRLLRAGTRNSWLELTLCEGKNRHIRRLLEVLGIGVQRLVRVSIGNLQLGTLAKGSYRMLATEEAQALAKTRAP